MDEKTTDFNELTLRQLQDKAVDLGFPREEIDKISSKSPVIAIIEAMQKRDLPTVKSDEVDPQEESNIKMIHDSKKRRMEAVLCLQPRVRILVPLEQGEKKGEVETVYNEKEQRILQQVKGGAVHTAVLNGFKFHIPRGSYTEVPEQIAKVIEEKFSQESSAGQEWKTDRIDPDTGRPVADALRG